MIKDYLFILYIIQFEKACNTKDYNKIKKLWKKHTENTEFLEYAIKIDNSNFNSNLIAYYILSDKNFYHTKIYQNLVEQIYSNKKLARLSINYPESFLLKTLENEDLKLTSEQKLFLIFEAEDSPFTEKYYKKNTKQEISIHGTGIFDIRYKLLENKNFDLQEKKNLIVLLYPDDEIKISILEELEWEIKKILSSFPINDDFYNLTKEDLIYIIGSNDIENDIIEKIELCRYIKKIVPEATIARHLNNE